MSVTPGEQLLIVVGSGGNSQGFAVYGGGGGAGNNNNQGWGGGGLSGVFRGGYAQANALCIGAGGGGSGYPNNAAFGGNGGGATGNNGGGPSIYEGQGGTQSSGGLQGSGSSQSVAPTAGSALQGGTGARSVSNFYGGGGGGGYFGGGGGGSSTNTSQLGGGGGGSSYATGTNQVLTPGANTNATGSANGSINITYTVNNPPTAPSSEPTITPNPVNTACTISWGGSSDPDGDTFTYDVELSLDNGSTWTVIDSGISGTSVSDSMVSQPATTTAKLRVRAKDSKGLYGAYTTMSGTFTIQHIQTLVGAASFSSNSTLTVGALNTDVSVAALSAAATLTQTGVVGRAGAVALSAASTLTTAAQVQEIAAAPLTATATLTTAAASILNGAAALNATSSLTAAGTLAAQGAAALNAVSTMTVGATRGVVGAATFSAASTLTTGAVRAATALSALSAGSALATDAVVLTSGQVTLTASSSLSTGVLVTDVATTGMSADSTLNVGGVVARNGAVDMISVSTMSGGTASVAMGIPLIGLSELDLNALVATVYDIQVGNAVSALPQPPTAYMSVSGESSLTVTPTLKVTGLAVFLPNSSLGWNTVYSGPVAVLGVSTMTQPVPDITIRSSMFLTGSTTMTTFGNLIQSHSSSEGGFVIEGFGALTVNPTYTPLPPRITVRNLLTVTPVMKTPVILKGQPVLPAYVGRSTSQMTTKGSYTVKTAPAASSTANVLPVPATFRWLAADVPGQQGQSVLQWPEHSGNGPSFVSNDSFAPTVADLLHYDTSAKHDINMGRVVNFYWRYAQHMGMVMDSANQMTTPRAYTVQFVLLAHTMTNSQFQHIWDAGELVADDYYTDPTSHTVEKISDAVYQNKVVPINDGQGDNRAYFGLRPNKVETLFNNTPHVAQLATTTTVDSRPMVYTCIFNAGTASKVRIRGYGVNETVAADHKTSVVNNFILGRVQGKIGSTAASHLNVWEVLYYNRALSEEELSVNSHWLGGVYNFGTYR